jgi:hypothetical protein
VEQIPFNLCEEFDKLNLRLVSNTEVVAMENDSTLSQDILKGQLTNEKIQEIKRNIEEGKSPGFTKYDQGVLWYKEESMYPTSRKSRTSYFEKLMILLILFTLEAIRCIKISKFPTVVWNGM